MMSLDMLAAAFVDELDFDTLIVWADILSVPHDEHTWMDDDWTYFENDLRVAVAEAMEKVGK